MYIAIYKKTRNRAGDIITTYCSFVHASSQVHPTYTQKRNGHARTQGWLGLTEQQPTGNGSTDVGPWKRSTVSVNRVTKSRKKKKHVQRYIRSLVLYDKRVYVMAIRGAIYTTYTSTARQSASLRNYRDRSSKETRHMQS